VKWNRFVREIVKRIEEEGPRGPAVPLQVCALRTDTVDESFCAHRAGPAAAGHVLADARFPVPSAQGSLVERTVTPASCRLFSSAAGLPGWRRHATRIAGVA
jgi:hypothetical protein